MFSNPIKWNGRVDGKAPEQLRWHQGIILADIFNNSFQYDFGIVGFECDEGVRRNLGRVGASKGPESLKKACANFPIVKNKSIADVGNVICGGYDLDKAQLFLGNVVSLLHQNNTKSIVFGGGHEVMYGHFSGLRKAYPTQKIGIINFDAHFDNRQIIENIGATSGTGFWQIAQSDTNYSYLAIGIQPNSNTEVLFNQAKESNTSIILAEEIYPENEKYIQEKTAQFLDDIDVLYITLCLDVFAAPFAPGVSAVAYNGLIPDYFFNKIFRKIAASNKLKAFDIAELNPTFDIDNRTAKLAASFVYEIVASSV